jgi:hypothetical protein
LTAAQAKKMSIELRSERVRTPGLPLAERGVNGKSGYGFLAGPLLYVCVLLE